MRGEAWATLHGCSRSAQTGNVCNANGSMPQRYCCRAISVRNCLNYKRNQLLSLQCEGVRARMKGGAGWRAGGFDSRQMCSHFRTGVLFGAQDRSCPSHVPQRTRYKFVTTNAWVQFEMCFFLAYAVRVSYTQNKKHMYKSRSAQRGLPAKLWGEQHLVHTLYLWYSLYRPRSELCTNWTQAQDM